MESLRAEADRKRSVRLLTFGVLMMILIFGLVNNYQSVVMNSVVASYHLTGGGQGIMSSMINIGSLAAFLAAPALQGRLKKSTMLLFACLLLVISFFLLGATRAYALMIFACLLAGVGFGWVDTNCNAMMVDLHPVDNAGKLGLLHGAFGIGGLTAPLLITALLAVMSWHGVSYLLSALVACTGVVFLAIVLRSAKGAPPVAPEQKLSLPAVKTFLFRRKNALMLLSAVLYAVLQAGLLIWVVRYMTLQYGAETLGSAALAIYWVFATLSRFFAPRIPLRPIWIFLIGSALAGVVQAIGVLSGSAVVMCVMVGVAGLVSGHCVPMLISEASMSEPGNSALVASSFLMSMCIVRIIVPVFMGFLAEQANLSVMMLMPAVSGVLAAFVACLVPLCERREKTRSLAKQKCL